MDKHHRKGFLAIPTDFALDPKITPRAAKVYLYLASNPGDTNRSIRGIAKDLGMHRNTVKLALDDLKGAGYNQKSEETRGSADQ